MRHRAYAGVVLLLTGGLPLVAAADGYAGSAACAPCHQVEFASEQRTPMSRALQLGEDADILRKHASLKFREGIYSTSITREGNRSFYKVTDGTQTIRVPLDWAFGVAVVGQTYVLTYNGDWYESRLSYYRALDNLDVTMGHANALPRSLEAALGRKIHTAERSECFACHDRRCGRKGSSFPGAHAGRTVRKLSRPGGSTRGFYEIRQAAPGCSREAFPAHHRRNV
jgi:hypothetical protein